MPEAYVHFMSAVGQRPTTLWQSCALGYFMGPAQYIQQIMRDGRFSNQFEIAFAFSAQAAQGGGVTLTPGTPEQPGQHAIMRYKAPAARYTLVAGWDAVSDDAALGRLSSADYKPFQRVMVAADQAEGLPPSTGEGMVGEIAVLQYRPGRVALRVTSERPAMLRASDMYTPDWRATVDDKPVKVRRCDYLFQGVYLEPGLHEVVLTYQQGLETFYVQLTGLALCLGALPLALRRRKSA
jgi:hypothetical protein